MDEDSKIVAADEVPSGDTVLFTVRDDTESREAILLALADGVVAFENYCPHWRDVRLDSGSGATLRDGELVCEKHGATFETGTGFCTFGPCEGATLPEIEVEAADGAVYLTDEDYEFEHLGPSADDGDDDDAGGRSGGGRIGFGGV